MKPLIVALTGASGSLYGVRLLELLKERELPVQLIVSAMGREVLRRETDLSSEQVAQASGAVLLADEDLAAPPASGSFPTSGMVICPASQHTVAAVAHGLCDTLIRRAAAVTLKERRPLIVVPREAPLSIPMLEGWLLLARAGAVVLPAAPPFYRRPRSLPELVDALVDRILSQLGLPGILPPWAE